MSSTSVRRHRATGLVVLFAALVMTGVGYAAVTDSASASVSDSSPTQIAQGRQLFLEGCATCHAAHLYDEKGDPQPDRIWLGLPSSDIHLEPFEKMVRLRYRVDGTLIDRTPPPKNLQIALMSRLKIMASLDIAERRLPQDGRMRVKVANKDYDLRVSFLPTVHGEKCVLRVLDKSNLSGSLEKIGMDPDTFKRFKAAVDAPHGLILVTGPTGSGKTTTLYSALNELNRPEYNIVTVEDPVEFQIPGINQVPTKKEIGLTFASALRSILRQDPDIVMIGEIRDTETAEIAVEASLTGHQVLSTLHCNDAPGALTRLDDMGIQPFLISSSVILDRKSVV